MSDNGYDDLCLSMLRTSADEWNAWRSDGRHPRPDLIRAELRGRKLAGYNLSGALLMSARLSEATLDHARLDGADLRGASLRDASLVGTDLRRAVLRHANLSGATITDAVFDGCEIYGTGLWDLHGQPASTKGMRLCATPERRAKASTSPAGTRPEPTPPVQGPVLEVDHLDAAQFLFVLLDNPRITSAFDALNSRIVLILGRFGGGNLQRLKAMQQRLVATGDFVPIVFDFDNPGGRSLTETLAGFAHLSLFVIADLTDPRSIPQELSHIVPFLPSVPVVPLLPEPKDMYSMFEHFQRYPWVLTPVAYGTAERLMEVFDEQVMKAGCQAAEHLRREGQRWRPPSVGSLTAAASPAPAAEAAAASPAPAAAAATEAPTAPKKTRRTRAA